MFTSKGGKRDLNMASYLCVHDVAILVSIAQDNNAFN